MSLINIENISAGYTKENIIEAVSFEIKENELVGILGANGSGKSTLIKAICNILPHTGKVKTNGKVIEELKVAEIASIISYIPQQSGINIDISVFDVVMMGFNSRLNVFEKPDAIMKKTALDTIDLLGLKDKTYANYMLLSEGQKQLTILARALVSDGMFLVFDEPESALDFNVRVKTIKRIKEWIETKKRCGLVILHDVMLALNNCDRVFLLKDKRIAYEIDLHNESIESIEKKLSSIYGDISLFKVKTKDGKNNFVMLFESEAK